MFGFWDDGDKRLAGLLEKRTLLEGVDPERLERFPGAEEYEDSYPDDGFDFLHEAAITEFKGRLFASWYNNPERELRGYTPVRESRSSDGGRTWSERRTVAGDEKLMFCPPVYGISGDKLYMLINEMVGPDLMNGLRIYRLNGKSDRFELIQRLPLPHKLNTNVLHLESGKLMIAARFAETGKVPHIPGVLINDSGDIEGEWRMVKAQPDRYLPDGTPLDCPEPTVIAAGNRIFLFCRNDKRKVPLMYESPDGGETWSAPMTHDIPFSDSKIYSGTLSDGRNYIVGNLIPGRTRLAIFFSKPGELVFNKGYLIQDGVNVKFGYGSKWHYPCCHESRGKLFVICTANVKDDDHHRGAVLSVLDIGRI